MDAIGVKRSLSYRQRPVGTRRSAKDISHMFYYAARFIASTASSVVHTVFAIIRKLTTAAA